jgi:hypothetical protein
MSEDQFRWVRAFIKQGRYHLAIDILREIDDPQARAWLEKLQTLSVKPKREPPNLKLPLLVIGLAIGVLILIAAVAFIPQFIEKTNEARLNSFLDDTEITADEEFYADLAHYCTVTVGYGIESCLDWVDLTLDEHVDAAHNCMGQADVETPEGRALIGDCLQRNDVPAPF